MSAYATFLFNRESKWLSDGLNCNFSIVNGDVRRTKEFAFVVVRAEKGLHKLVYHCELLSKFEISEEKRTRD